MSGPEAALAVCRFAHDAAVMLLWGAFAYLAALVPPDLGREIGRRFDALTACAIVASVVTTAAALPIEAAAMGNGWADGLDGTTIRDVLFETSIGHIWQIQAGAAVLLALTLVLPRGARLAATAVTSGLLLATLALTGHAAMHTGWLGLAHRLNAAGHVLAGGAWFGALLPLPDILRALDDPDRRRAAGLALRRFSLAGHGAVALVISTGVVNTWLILGRWPTDWSSPYQAILAAKIVLVMIMTGLALANRYILVPRLTRFRVETVRDLRLATMVAIGLGAAVIGCVGVFGLLEPAG